MRKYFEIILLIVVLCFVGMAKTRQESPKPYVIMVSFDGFRHDYVEKYNAPNFKEFIKNGVAAEAMTPSFPSKTFPNHYSLVTGLYPDHHGLVDNTFYDKELDLQYSIGNRERVENPAFYGGLPLWQLVQQNGMKSASYFWVGSEAPVAGSFPSYYHKYSDDVDNETRVNATIDWLKLPIEDRPHFITLYFSLVDSKGHSYGPEHEETKAAVLEADRLLGLLKTGVEALNLPVDIIVVSDHGMEPIYPKRENYIDFAELTKDLNTQVKSVNNGPHAHFYIDDVDIKEKTFQTLKSKENNFKVYRKEKLPKHLHYGTHERVGDIMIIVEPGHYLSSTGRIKNNIDNQITRGEHGFDPYHTPNMGAIFYANGPSFKSGLKIGEFENVNVYPLVTKILGIDHLPNLDGRLEVLKKILK
ncbi:MAG TPA: ectonucleotide pyrophosphatase/phosphodiesterase [Roseivirga sp.]